MIKRKSPRGWVPGDCLSTCDFCGFRYMFSELRKMWTGQYACPYDYDEKPDHMLPTRQYPNEGKPVKGARPDTGFTYIDPTVPPDPDSL